MKTISIKKRLAAVTVLALAAGVMSSVAANAVAVTPTNARTTWSYISPVVAWTANDTSGAASTLGSSGIIGTSFTVQSALTAAKGVMLANGRLALHIDATSNAHDTLVVTGGQVIGVTSNTVGPTTLHSSVNTDGSKVDLVSTDADGVNLLIAPTVAAGGTITIQRFSAALSAFGGSAIQNFLAIVTVAPASASGTVSTSNSKVYLDKPVAAASAAGAATYDEPSGFTVPVGSVALVDFTLLDAYKAQVSGDLLQISSDNCYVQYQGGYSTKKAYYSAGNYTSYSAGAASDWFGLTPAVANTATNCTATISYGGTVVATKTVKFLGDIATVTVVSNGVESQSGAAIAGSPNYLAGLLSVTYKDAAGNVVPGPVPSIDSGNNAYVTSLGDWQYTPQSDGTAKNTAGNNQSLVPGSAGYGARAIAGKGAVGSWTCGGSSGSASLVLKVTNAAYATIKSAPVTLACGANPDSYTIATDKTTYAAGDIATVTITFKDANGAVPNDVYAFGTVGTNVVASGAFPSLVTAAMPADTSTNGVLKYKAIVGQVAGTFPVVVSVPDVNAAHGKDQTATITVTSQATDAVSQLVKVVGTLLTSFTKQIAALIKALAPAKKK